MVGCPFGWWFLIHNLFWFPAFAGMTEEEGAGMTEEAYGNCAIVCDCPEKG